MSVNEQQYVIAVATDRGIDLTLERNACLLRADTDFALHIKRSRPRTFTKLV